MALKTIGLAALATLGLFVLSTAANASEEKEAAALKSAERWLSLVDAGDYDGSWQAAAGYFRNAVSQAQWRQSLNAARRPLGKALSRTVRSKSFRTRLPGAPDGQYVVIQFATSFENKRSGIETVTPMLDEDGSWRVSGYYIK